MFNHFRKIGILLALTALLNACTTERPQTVLATNTFVSSSTVTATSIPSLTASPTNTATATQTGTYTRTPTVQPSLTASITPSLTPSFTPVPTYVVLRGIVNQEHVNCYYGPSKAYLYKYGLLKENRLDIIGWMPDTGYIEVQAIGGDNPCWMNLEFMDVQGDIQNVKPVNPEDIKMPWSPYYKGLTFAKAERNGDEVTVSWAPLKLKAGDNSEQENYLLEAWVCRNGKLTFVPVGAYENTAKVLDEPGCNEPSHARVYGVEKHGYTAYLQFDWPKAD